MNAPAGSSGQMATVGGAREIGGAPGQAISPINAAEIEQTFVVCVDIIDSPPPDYKFVALRVLNGPISRQRRTARLPAPLSVDDSEFIHNYADSTGISAFWVVPGLHRDRIVRQAVLGIAQLASLRDDLRPVVVVKLLQVVGEASSYRSHPRRYAVTSLAYLTYFDPKLVHPALDLLSTLVHRRTESSQFVRKAAFVALSRIGRKYPETQPKILPLFYEQLQDPKAKASVIFGIISGLGRMAQSNALLRTEFAPELIKYCTHEDWTIRWGGILGLGHAVCPIGDVQNDPVLETKCFDICLELLRHGGVPDLEKKKVEEMTAEDWKREDFYFVQYAAAQALGLLLRSNPDKWWEKLAPIFAEILVQPRYAARTKAMVLITYGKIAYYMSPDNPYYSAIKDMLFKLSKHENILVAEPAVYGLCNFALAHEELYEEVKTLLIEKLDLRRVELAQTSPQALAFYLKTWCKLLSRSYQPVLNLCSNVISTHSQEKVAKGDGSDRPLPTAFTSASFDDQAAEAAKESKKARGPLQMTEAQERQRRAKNDAHDNARVIEVCSAFSSSVIESLVMLLEDTSLFEDKDFLANLKSLILAQHKNSGHATPNTPDERDLVAQISVLLQKDMAQRECALIMLATPQVFDDPVWVTNTKVLVRTASAHPGLALSSSAVGALNPFFGTLTPPPIRPPIPNGNVTSRQSSGVNPSILAQIVALSQQTARPSPPPAFLPQPQAIDPQLLLQHLGLQQGLAPHQFFVPQPAIQQPPPPPQPDLATGLLLLQLLQQQQQQQQQLPQQPGQLPERQRYRPLEDLRQPEDRQGGFKRKMPQDGYQDYESQRKRPKFDEGQDRQGYRGRGGRGGRGRPY